MMHDAPNISDSVMDKLVRESGLYIPGREDRVSIVKELEHARVNDSHLDDSNLVQSNLADFHNRMKSADIRLKYRGHYAAVFFARSLIGFCCSKRLEGTRLLTESFDWNYHTGIMDRKQAANFEEQRAYYEYDIYLGNLGRDVLTPEQNQKVEEFEKSKNALIGKALRHFNNAISTWKQKEMRKRNILQVYRVAKAANCYFELALITGEGTDYNAARTYIAPLKESLVFVTTEKDRNFIRYVIDRISKTAPKCPANPAKHP